jgi:hypothetical protein
MCLNILNSFFHFKHPHTHRFTIIPFKPHSTPVENHSYKKWCQKQSTRPFCWTDSVRNEEVLYRAKDVMEYRKTIQRNKANWIGHILLRKSLLKHIIEGQTEEWI